MSNPGSNSSAQQPQPEDNSKPSRPPRGRGTRGGRGRGRGQDQPKPQALTFKDRMAQVASSNAAPVTPLPATPVPLSTLSAMMDSAFPVTLDPVRYVSDVFIDTNGYVDLCATVYHNITAQKEEYTKMLSQDEFLLACGWLHAFRALSVRNTVSPVTINGYLEMEQSMKALPPIPEPIVQYLEGMGLYRDAHGNTLAPNVALPIRRDQNEGIIPGLLSNEMAQARMDLIGSMFPYGMYERRILAAQDDEWIPYLRIQPLDAAVTDEHADNFDNRTLLPFIQRAHMMPFPNYRVPPHAHRIPHLIDDPSPEGLLLLKSIRWSRKIFVDFIAFCHRIQKTISCVPYPTSTAGSPAMTSCAEPIGSMVKPDRFRFYGFMALNSSEQHASRLFRYRVKLTERAQHPVNDVDHDVAYKIAPHHMTGPPPLELTELRTTQMYLQYYVARFVKT